MGSLALRPGDSLTILFFLDGFVNRLQDFQFPSFLLFKLRGFELLPRWDFHPLFMPAFAGRTLVGTYPGPRGRYATQVAVLGPVFESPIMLELRFLGQYSGAVFWQGVGAGTQAGGLEVVLTGGCGW
jgi:hypothetical protein